MLSIMERKPAPPGTLPAVAKINCARNMGFLPQVVWWVSIHFAVYAAAGEQ